MTELDYAVDSLEMSEDDYVALLNATKDLRSKVSYVYNVYKFWDNAPEFKDFDNMHSYMLKKSKASPSSFSTTLKYARGSYNTVADSVKEGRLGRVKFGVNCGRRRRLQASFELSLARHC